MERQILIMQNEMKATEKKVNRNEDQTNNNQPAHISTLLPQGSNKRAKGKGREGPKHKGGMGRRQKKKARKWHTTKYHKGIHSLKWNERLSSPGSYHPHSQALNSRPAQCAHPVVAVLPGSSVWCQNT